MEELLHLFPPHYVCWNNQQDVILLHAIGGILTAIAYYTIPTTLLYLTRRYAFDARVKFIFWVYAVFIFLCGSTHVMDVVLIWKSNESMLLFDGWLRIATGVVSVASAAVTIWAAVKFLSYAQRLIGLTVEMASQRREFEQVKQETWNRFQRAINDMRLTLNRMDDRVEVATDE